MADGTRFVLPERAIPTHWYNVVADLPSPPPPPLHPGRMDPVGPDDLAPLFPMAIIGQEVTSERHVPIPEAVREVYKLWRPTPLYRAHRLEKALDLPKDVRIFYKYEGDVPPELRRRITDAAATAARMDDEMAELLRAVHGSRTPAPDTPDASR